MGHGLSIGLIIAAALSCSSPAPGQSPASADQSAADVLSAVSKTISAPPSVQVNISTTETLNRADGIRETTATASQVWFKKPNLLLLVHQTPVGATITYCNGTSITTYRPVFKAYHSEKQPPDALFEILSEKLGKVSAAIVSGLADQLPRMLDISPQDLKVRSIRTAAGQSFDEIELTTAPTTGLLTTPGSSPFPALVTMSDKVGEDAITTLTSFTWNISQDYDPVMFSHVPSPDTVRVKTKAELTGGEMPGLPEGSPAPPVTLPVSPEGELNTHRLKGKILVLDFFVTKCIGCKSTMTTLTEILRAYKDEDVEVIPINVKEKREVVESYFKDNNLSIPIALDLDGKAAAAYRIQKVPQTFVIDRKGIIRHIHVGLQPHFREKLAGQLDKLLEE